MSSVDCVEKRKQLNVDILNDWLKIGTMMMVARFLELKYNSSNNRVQMNNGLPLHNEWARASVFFLLGITTYHIVTKQILPLTSSNAVIQSVIDDWLKVGTALTVQRLLEGGKLEQKWLMSSLYTILGFTAFNVIGYKFVPPVHPAYQTALTTFMKTGTMLVVSRLLEEKPFDNRWVTSSACTLIGFASYDLVVSDYVRPLQRLVRGELSLNLTAEKNVNLVSLPVPVPVPVPVQVQANAQVQTTVNANANANAVDSDDEDDKDDNKDEQKKVEGYINLGYASY
jgi:hypothetical protein